jgi:hypothetical protein
MQKLLNCRTIIVVGTTSNKSAGVNNIVEHCLQAVDNLSTSWEQAVRTHSDNKLLNQHWQKCAAGLIEVVRFYVCRNYYYLFILH